MAYDSNIITIDYTIVSSESESSETASYDISESTSGVFGANLSILESGSNTLDLDYIMNLDPSSKKWWY